MRSKCAFQFDKHQLGSIDIEGQRDLERCNGKPASEVLADGRLETGEAKSR
jgi:hypothetical protein